MAIQLLELQSFSEAKAILEKLAVSAKKDPEVWFLLSAVHGLLNIHDKAEYYSRKTIALAPNLPDAHFNLANALREQKKFAEAIREFEKTLSLKPDHLGALINVAGVFDETGAIDKAYSRYMKAVQLAPTLHSNYYNLAKILTVKGEFDEAIKYYHAALERKPDDIDSRNNLSRILLGMGRYSEGWDHYQYRLSVRTAEFKSPDILPNDLTGKRLLLVYDQGLGDEIFFMSFAPQLKARGAWIAYQPGHQKIASLFKRVTCIDEVISDDHAVENIDYRISIGDLPRLLGHTDNSPHPASPEIPVRDENLANVKQLLANFGPPPYVGVTWRAGAVNRSKSVLFKEFSLTDLAEICKPLDARIVILQRLPEAGEVDQFSEILGRPVLDLSHYNEQLEDMLAVLSILDDYIGVSNTNMHMRAAVGKTCRVLVPFPPEWRWHMDGSSPWFPDFQVYRQKANQDWQPAIRKLREELAASMPVN